VDNNTIFLKTSFEEIFKDISVSKNRPPERGPTIAYFRQIINNFLIILGPPKYTNVVLIYADVSVVFFLQNPNNTYTKRYPEKVPNLMPTNSDSTFDDLFS
jgi:hypothetical protein